MGEARARRAAFRARTIAEIDPELLATLDSAGWTPLQITQARLRNCAGAEAGLLFAHALCESIGWPDLAEQLAAIHADFSARARAYRADHERLQRAANPTPVLSGE